MTLIIPHWPAPTTVHAFSSTKEEGNMAIHTGREQLRKELSLVNDPLWLHQIHSDIAIEYTDTVNLDTPPDADASYTHLPHHPCLVMTADCLPILICNTAGTEVAAIHAGWRGVLNGIIEKTIKSLESPPSELLAWLGPAIGPEALELNETIRLDFLTRNPQNGSAFKQRQDSWYADIYELGRICLRSVGVTHLYGGGFCTYSESERFFSYRRAAITGRMATLIFFA